MAKFPALPLWIDSYLGDTPPVSAVTWEHHGIYLLLLMKAWLVPGCRIPDDDQWLSLHMGCSPEEVAKRVRPVLATYFKSDGKWLRQKRLSKERKYVEKKSLLQRGRAKARWDKGKDIYRERSPAMPDRPPGNAPTPTPTPTPNKQVSSAQPGLSHAAQAVALADQLAEIANVSPASQPGFAAASEIITWLESGCDPERDIKPAVADVVARLKAGSKAMPRSWSYFRNSVTERRDARLAGLPARPVNGQKLDKPRMIAAAAAREVFKTEPDPSAHLSPAERADMAERVKARVMASLKRPP